MITSCRSLSLLFIMSLGSLFAAEVEKITPAQAAARVRDSQAVLVDIREPAEWAETGVAAPAVLLPKSDFDGDQKLWKAFLAANGDKPIILYCRSGKRAAVLGAALAEKGHRVTNAGGLKDWTDAGLPVRQGTETAK